MVKKIRLFAVAGFGILAFIIVQSCASSEVAESKDVNQKQIYQHYSVVYDASDNYISTEASFRFGGSKGITLMLSTPASVKVNDMEMNGQEGFIKGYFYSNNNFNAITRSFVFVYTDFENNVSRNQIDLFPVENILSSDTIYSEKETLLTWDGFPVQTGEQVICEIKDANGTKISIKTTTEGIHDIHIPAGRLRNLVEGVVNIQLTREIDNYLVSLRKLSFFTSGV